MPVVGESGVESMIGTNGLDRITTFSSGADSISGLGGDDTIFGGNGNDTSDAGTGTDVVHVQEGNDSLLRLHSWRPQTLTAVPRVAEQNAARAGTTHGQGI